MPVNRRWFALAAWLAWGGCTTNHKTLARGDDGGAPATAGQAPSRGGFGGGLVVTGGTRNAGAGGRAPEEPRGTDVLTIVHGIVDAPTVRLCFRAGTGEAARLIETPRAAQSLGFGNRVVIRSLEGVDFAEDDLAPIALTGDLSLVEDLDCAGALDRARVEQDAVGSGDNAGGSGGSGAGIGGSAGETAADLEGGEANLGGAGGATEPGRGEGLTPEPPRLRAGELPLVPAGTLTNGRSLLFVMNGCLGGPAFAGRFATDACGAEYRTSRPTLGAVLVAVSRKPQFLTSGFQVLHASLATGTVALQSAQTAAEDAGPSPLLIATSLALGVITPRSPRTDLPSLAWGAGIPGYALELLGASPEDFREVVLRSVPWEDALDNGGVEAIEDGRNYVIVLIGPRADLTQPGFWNAPTLTIVESDPVAEGGASN